MSGNDSLTHNLSTSFPLPQCLVQCFSKCVSEGSSRRCRSKRQSAPVELGARRVCEARLPSSVGQFHSRLATGGSCCDRIRPLLLAVCLLPAMLLGDDDNARYAGYPGGFAVTASPRPGGIAVVDIGPTTLPKPSVHWNDQPILVLPHVSATSSRWHALVGLPLDTSAGTHTLQVYSTTPRVESFDVRRHQYPVQRLLITDKRKVNPYAKDLDRIEAEAKRVARAKQHHSEVFTASAFILPVTGVTSSQFGLRRIYNGEPRRPHGGHDIAAVEGTPIVATAAGTVIDAGDFFFNGNSVFLDHGFGLLSLYSHLHQINVQIGDTVAAGQLIGEVGKTGRVTGAHLHWSVGLNGTWIDPMLLLPRQINTATGTVATTK